MRSFILSLVLPFILVRLMLDKRALSNASNPPVIHSVAPEVLLGEGHDQNVDWWSYGVLVHLLLTGEVW